MDTNYDTDELVRIDNLYVYIDMHKFHHYLARHTVRVDMPFTEQDMPLRVNTLYPATNVDSTWISVYLPSNGLTSFPVDLVARFTNTPASEV